MAENNNRSLIEFKLHRRYILKGIATIAITVLLLIAAIIISSAIGITHIPLSDVMSMLAGKLFGFYNADNYSLTSSIVLFDIRLPRILMACFVGAALAVAGASYQGLLHNPLADPYLTGVSQGAALGAIVGFLLPFQVPSMAIPLMGFTVAIACVIAVFYIARTGNRIASTTLILGGVAAGAFLASITSFLITLSGDKVHGIIFWLLGSFAMADWSSVAIIAPYVIVSTAIILLLARPLNVMQLDEEQAQQLGINVERIKLIVIAAATVATAAAVCFCGIIGFVGIIIPHAVRIIFGPDYRLLLPMSVLCGALFMMLADTAARTLLSPTEIPVGVITALIGAPFFLYILKKKKQAIF